MDRPSAGEIWLQDLPLHLQDEENLTQIRRTRIGFVFQFFHLLPAFTVEENVGLPLLLGGGNHGQGRVGEILEAVSLSHRRRALPSQLSGGEMQRAAVARALVHRPAVVLADEPTGNLDSENGARVLELLRRMAGTKETAVVMATHSELAAKSADRILAMRDGRLI
jgi:putative ABC transport system ATP-binding protein